MKPWAKIGLYWSFAATMSLGACGGDEDTGPDEPEDTTPDPIPNAGPVPQVTSLDCPTGTYLTYENFGEGFMLNYCTSCHSQHVPEAARGGAPLDANFDVPGDVLLWRDAIMTKSLTAPVTMPPLGLVAGRDLLALKEWMKCGAPSGEAHLKP